MSSEEHIGQLQLNFKAKLEPINKFGKCSTTCILCTGAVILLTILKSYFKMIAFRIPHPKFVDNIFFLTFLYVRLDCVS